MRAALYARFSSDLQKQTSIEDQFLACRTFAARQGIKIVDAYDDAAISGASTASRQAWRVQRGDLRSSRSTVAIAG